MQEKRPIQILYDGNCPICCQQVGFLKNCDHEKKLQFSDIREAGIDVGISMEQLEKQIHAVLPDGTVISRMDVVRIACREVGLGWLVAPTDWPLLRTLFDMLYSGIAKYRHCISRLFLR